MKETTQTVTEVKTETRMQETMSIKEIRAMTGLSQSKFANLFDIPVRSIQEWEQERKSPPPYVPGMMLRILKHEFFKQNGPAKKRTTGGKKS